MRSKTWFWKACLILFFLGLVLGSCGRETADERGEISYPEEIARLISQSTSGLISSNDAIRVRFASPVVSSTLAGQTVSTRVFEFEPSIDGVTQWEDAQTLVFKPNARLPMRASYSATLDIAKLLPELADKNPQPFTFNFEVAGREIARASTDFQLQQANDPRMLSVTGEIVFTEPTELSDVQNATRLRLEGRQLNLEWRSLPGGREYHFTSAEFERGKKELRFELTVDDQPLNLSQEYVRRFSMSALQDLAVQSTAALTDGEQTGVILRFSDELDPAQDVAGLVAVNPSVAFNLKKIGREIILSGNFERGQNYAVMVSPGVRSRFGTTVTTSTSYDVYIEELKPQIKFAADGVFLTSANYRSVRFLTLNVKAVRLRITRVFENNLGQFLQTEQIASRQSRNEDFNRYYVERVGVEVIDQTLEISDTRNTWQQHELDLKKLISENDQGVYLLHISFRREDMLYTGSGDDDEIRRNRYEDYYSDPNSPGYIYANGNIFKPVIVSDIGLTYKKAFDRHIVFATDLLTTLPLNGATVRFISYQNQVLGSVITDSEGRAELPVEDNSVFYVEAEKNGQRSIIKPNEMAWNLSTFDTDGVDDVAKGTRAFIYTERGVYRPGDPVNISVIARNDDGSFPKDHPVTMEIRNPLNQKVFEQTSRQATDGFYNFRFQGTSEDPTGNYQVSVKVGSQTFLHTLKIETVAPFRLKVQVQPDKNVLTSADRFLNVRLQSNYLFGNPAAGLQARLQLTVQKNPPVFPAYKNFVFDNETIEYQSLDMFIFDGKLNNEGIADISYQLPALENAPTALSARLEGTVFEKGGRPNTGSATLPVHPYDRYVGIKLPEFDWGYARVGSPITLQGILVNTGGKPAPGRTLNYRIYKGLQYWWWEYDARDEFQLRFKSHSSTQLVKEGSIVSQSLPANIEFTPEDNGAYLVEIQDGEDGHSAGAFLSAYRWGEAASGPDANILAIKTDREQYQVGETATITFPAPEEGNILVTLEKGKRVLSSDWLAPSGEEQMQVPIELTAEMTPTVYLTLSIIQPHSQTRNDRPLRTYGVVPINVENRSSRQYLEIEAPAELRSKAPFQVKLRTTDKKPTQLTVAVVDEGLLDITNFRTPDPWKYFYQKLRLGVESYDLFNHVIGANKGDVFRVFSIGGGMDEYRAAQTPAERRKRFKPVAMFRGPLQTNASGEVTLDFEMPNYIGSVRVMAVSAVGNRFGSAEKAIPVKTELMVQSSLPRVIGAGDEFIVPATVFAMKEGIADATVSLKVDGPLEIVSEAQQQVNFSGIGERDVQYRIKAKPAIGAGKITLSASGGGFSADEETDIEIRANSPRISTVDSRSLAPGEKISIRIPGDGIEGSNNASINLSTRPNMDFKKRLGFLIRYPYGCIEQTTSAVFPQLYLKNFIREMSNKQRVRAEDAFDIDANINAGIDRLQHFRLPSGGFSYWPGNRDVSPWGTNFAGHFLIEAKNLGYSVPSDMLRDWVSYQKSAATAARDDMLTRVYRVYLLALAGEPHMAAMNLLKENSLSTMTDTEKWLLAGAYRLAGVNNVAQELTRNLGMTVKEYWEFGGTYGSTLRDKAIILEMQRMFGNWTAADGLAAEISGALSVDQWYSTQTVGYCLLSLGKYLLDLRQNSDSAPLLKATLTLPGGQTIPVNTDQFAVQIPIESGFGQELTVAVDGATTSRRVFANLAWEGIPLQSTLPTSQKNLALTVEWFNEDGAAIDPASVTQGQSFWAHFRVENSQRQYRNLENLALVQVLPAGWEIQNTRLSGEYLPEWMPTDQSNRGRQKTAYLLNRETYLDIRDDRVMWFFDLRGYEGYADFVVKLSAVTAGQFSLPATIVEAMYNEEYQATVAGKTVLVRTR